MLNLILLVLLRVRVNTHLQLLFHSRFIVLNRVTLTDIALIHNNAKVGSQIAVALSKYLNGATLENKTLDGFKQSADSGSDIVSANTRIYEARLATADSTQYPQCFSPAGGHRRNKC